MQAAKIQAITNFNQPKTIKGVQRFLGLCNYYRSFIKNYSSIASPFFDLLKKSNSEFVWGENAEKAFAALKTSFQNGSFLILPDRKCQFLLYTDCSKLALGAALHQKDKDGTEKPVAFFSRTLT
jgi:hypothetical protein